MAATKGRNPPSVPASLQRGTCQTAAERTSPLSATFKLKTFFFLWKLANHSLNFEEGRFFFMKALRAGNGVQVTGSFKYTNEMAKTSVEYSLLTPAVPDWTWQTITD